MLQLALQISIIQNLPSDSSSANLADEHNKPITKSDQLAVKFRRERPKDGTLTHPAAPLANDETPCSAFEPAVEQRSPLNAQIQLQVLRMSVLRDNFSTESRVM
jgi:hypothetical protein